MRAAWMVSSAVALMLGVTGIAFAEDRPLEQLPDDVFRWSTMWTNVPKEMAEVGHEDGALAAVTVGPAKGAVRMVEATTLDVWHAVKENDREPKHLHPDDPKGVVFRYTF